MTREKEQSAGPVTPAGGPPNALRIAGSLWFAAVLLMLLLVAMACATVFESAHGTEQALAAFYHSWWFEMLLLLVAVSVLSALTLRYPFSRRQIGFVVTHVSILVVLAGALVTKHFGVNGQVSVGEGQTVDHFGIGQPTLTIAGRVEETQSAVDLGSSVFGGFRAVDHPKAPVLSLDKVRVEVERYLPDSLEQRRVVNDDPHERRAVEVSFSASGEDAPTWVFEGRTATAGSQRVAFRVVPDSEELSALLSEAPATQPASKGTVKVELKGSTFEFPLEDCTGEAVPMGETGYTVRVLRYLPHANVGPDNKLRNASDRPVNPAIEAEFVGPEGSETRLAFARFPDFGSMHGTKQIEGLKLTFVTSAGNAPTAPIEVLIGPAGEMYVRFSRGGAEVVTRKLSIGTPVESPWPGRKFAVRRRFDHARVDWTVEPVDPVRKNRVPAVLVKLIAADQTREMWLQKQAPRPVTIDGTAYELGYGDKSIRLGFDLTLKEFAIGYYPGGRRPRSFESQITITDPATGRSQNRLVSMNHPTKYGGYTFYQSSYRQQTGRPDVSVLSVARDPGWPIVFVGYIAMMLGMLVVLTTRMVDRRRMLLLVASAEAHGQGRALKAELSATRRGAVSNGSRGDGKHRPRTEQSPVASGSQLQR